MPTIPPFPHPQSAALHSGRMLFAVWACLALPWMLAWFAFASLGGWPLNDDPFYAKPLALWAEDGHWQWVRQNGALTASSVGHVLAGALVTGEHSFGYRALFLVCILQQSLGAAALFWTARALNVSTSLAWLAAFSLSTFPLYYGHAFTFMTDGPATAWGAIACSCAALGIVRGDWRWLCAASIATGWGYWIRQTNGLLLVAPLTALCLLAIQNYYHRSRREATDRIRSKPGLGQFLALLLIATAAGVLLESGWLFSSSAARARDVAPTVQAGYLHRTMIGAYGWLLICGWYTLPWVVLLIQEALRARRDMSRWASRLCMAGAIICWTCAVAPLVTSEGRACLTSATGSFIQNAHFGPVFLSDMDEPGRWGTLDGVVWPWWYWQSLSALSLLSVACLAWWGICTALRWLEDFRAGAADEHSASALGFLWMTALAVLAIVFFIEPHMDRYWLFLLPALSVWWLHLAVQHQWNLTRAAMVWALLCIVGNTGVSVVFTHDMLAWNDARWRYVNAQLASGMRAESIDAGRDVNAWLRMDEDPDTRPRAGDPSPWWSGRATVALAVGERPSWHLVERLPWNAWATGRTHHLWVLERDDVKAPAVGFPAVKDASP